MYIFSKLNKNYYYYILLLLLLLFLLLLYHNYNKILITRALKWLFIIFTADKKEGLRISCALI